jgi:hypothetical protein
MVLTFILLSFHSKTALFMPVQFENLAISLPIALVMDCLNSMDIPKGRKTPQNTLTKRQFLRLLKQSKQYLDNVQGELLSLHICEVRALRERLFLDENKALIERLTAFLDDAPQPQKKGQIEVLNELKNVWKVFLETITDIINLSDIDENEDIDENAVFQAFELKYAQKVCFHENGERRKGTNMTIEQLFEYINKPFEQPLHIW